MPADRLLQPQFVASPHLQGDDADDGEDDHRPHHEVPDRETELRQAVHRPQPGDDAHEPRPAGVGRHLGEHRRVGLLLLWRSIGLDRRIVGARGEDVLDGQDVAVQLVGLGVLDAQMGVQQGPADEHQATGRALVGQHRRRKHRSASLRLEPGQHRRQARTVLDGHLVQRATVTRSSRSA